MSYRDPRDLRVEAERLLAIATAIENGAWHEVCEGEGTAAALAARTDCSEQAANNRLRALYDLRLADREAMVVEGGGRRFVYRVALETARERMHK